MNIVHIGLQRTGNSLLKDSIFSNLNDYFYIGKIRGIYPNDKTKELINRISFQDSLDYEPEYARSLLDELRGDDPRRVLISDEIFSVEGRADRRLIAERLYDLFSPAKVLINLRSQRTMVQAIYLKHMTSLGSRMVSLDLWLDENYREIIFRDAHRMNLNYEPIVRAYFSVFGDDNVVVLPSELMHDDGSSYSCDISCLLGVPVESVRESLRVNMIDQRVPWRHLMVHRLESGLPSGANLALIGRAMLPAKIYKHMKLFVSRGVRVDAPDISQEWEERIVGICGQGNLMLERSTGLPLRELGYPMPTE